MIGQGMPVQSSAHAAAAEQQSAVEGGVVEAVDVGAELAAAVVAVEIGGREGPEPTRFGDWEKNGRCIDF